MGSLFKPKVPAPPAPPPAPVYQDQIGGTEQVATTNAAGQTVYITRRLPLTPEQQAQQDQYNAVMKSALSEIRKLSDVHYQADAATQNVLNQWEAKRTSLLNSDFQVRSAQEDAALAQRGLGSSSVANDVQRMRALDRQQALADVQQQKDALALDVRSRQLDAQKQLYDLAASQQNMDAVNTMRSAATSQQGFKMAESAAQASLSDYYNRQLTAQQSRVSGTVLQPLLFGSSLLGGGGFAGVLGGASALPVGGFLGGLFGRR